LPTDESLGVEQYGRFRVAPMASIADVIQATLDEVLFARLLLVVRIRPRSLARHPEDYDTRGHVCDETTISGADAG